VNRRPVRVMGKVMAALAFAGCAGTATNAPPAVSGVHRDPVGGGANGTALKLYLEDDAVLHRRVLYAHNDGDTPVTITSLDLYSCTNLLEPCSRYTPNVDIAAHHTGRVMEFGPANPKAFYTFGYRYQYHRAGPPESRTDSARTMVQVRRDVSSASAPILADPERFRPTVAAIDRAGACDRPRSFLPGTYVVGMRFGSPTRPSRLVQITIDSATGEAITYSDMRGDLTLPGNTTDFTAAPVGLRTHIGLDLRHGMGTAENEGGGIPSATVMVRAPAMLSAASLGHPQAMIDRLLKECMRGQ
jgi:hypothetical protein